MACATAGSRRIGHDTGWVTVIPESRRGALPTVAFASFGGQAALGYRRNLRPSTFDLLRTVRTRSLQMRPSPLDALQRDITAIDPRRYDRQFSIHASF